jgi:protein TonB
LPDAGSSLLRRYTPVSLILHAAGFALLALPPVQRERPVFAQPIYEVALVRWPVPNYEPPIPSTPRKKQAEPAKTPKKEAPKPKDAIPVKSSKPKPKADTKTEAKAESAPEAKSIDQPPGQSPVGTPNGNDRPVSLGQVDQEGFRHDYYLELLRTILARSWDPPLGGEGILTASVHFVIQRDGTITAPEIVGSSGWSLYDRSALGAVLTARKLPPLPEGYDGDHIGLTVNFQRVGDEP